LRRSGGKIRFMEMHVPSRAKAYFDKISLPENGANFLAQLVSSPTPTLESEFLDFKGGQQLEVNGTDFRELWAKNLSCFANSDGGVVVFGIDAPKGSAKNLSLVQDVTRLQAKLKELLKSVTEPPVQRVDIEVYRDPPNANTGFVVCYIPASPWRPHQVRLEGQPHQFYIRAADHCVPCNHSTLRALFVPQFVSRLEIYYQSVIRTPALYRDQREVLLRCWVENAGPATASEVLVQYEKPFNHANIEFVPVWEPTASEQPIHALLAKRSIHPEERVRLFDASLGLLSAVGVPQSNDEGLTFKFSISARNQLPVKYTMTIRAQEFEDKTIKKAILVENTV
jgi:schlafen family protein